MSVDKEVMTLQVPVLQADQLRPPKTHPLHPKNTIQSTHNPPPTASSQRIGKRRYSLGAGFKRLAKRRRRANSDSQSEPVLPSNFLLGGNIFDPLNLNSLLDEEVNRYPFNYIPWYPLNPLKLLLYNLYPSNYIYHGTP